MAHLLSIRFDATACQYTGYGGIPKFGFRNIMAAAFTKLEEICENARMGREYALLGDYETAQIYYQSVLQQISQYTSTLKDTQQKQRWHKVREELSKELDQVKEVQSILNSFKGPLESAAAYPQRADKMSHQGEDVSSRDPDVWPPPTPVEQPR
jgi:katanin p60 ATPase-containing subunit A1